MTIARFCTGMQFAWRRQVFEIKRRVQNKRIHIYNVATGDEQIVEVGLLLHEYSEGKLNFRIDENTDQDIKEEATRRLKKLDLSDYPTNQIEIARYRLKVIEPLLALRPEEIPKKVVRARAKEIREEINRGHDPQNDSMRNAISTSSIFRWIARYEESGSDLRSLIPDTLMRGGKGKSRLAPEVETIIGSVFDDLLYRREKVTGVDLLHEIAVRIEDENEIRSDIDQLAVPSLSTIYERLKDLDDEKVFRAKHGSRASKRKFSQYNRMDFPKQPLIEVQMDFTRGDLIVVDEEDNLPLGRPTVGLVLDLATRSPLGFFLGFEPESYLAVMEGLYHAILPKIDLREKYQTENEWLPFGIPDMLHVDNSRAFRSESLKDACMSLGITLKYGPPRTPHLRGSIERMFRSTTALFHSVPGTVFSNVVMRGDYQSEGKACVSLQDLEKMLVTFLIDIYSQSYHRGLGDIPARRWEEAVAMGFMPRVPPSAEDLRILLGRVEYRTVQHYGIDLHRIRYNSSELIPLRTRIMKHQNLSRKNVKVKFHPGDLSRIHVFDPFEERYIEVSALDQLYTQGLSLWKHRVILRFTKETEPKVDLAALGRAKRKLRQIIEEARSRKRISGRHRIARFEEGGKTPSLQNKPKENSSSGHQLHGKAKVKKKKKTLPARKSQGTNERLDVLVEEGWTVEMPPSSEDVGE